MPKITFKARVTAWEQLNKECKELSLKRDDFLNRVIDLELDWLEKISPCDDEGSAWLDKHWMYHNKLEFKSLEVIPVSVTLSEGLIKSIQTICSEKKVPRDAFLDLAIQFVIVRILEPMKIIKNPRIDTDIYSNIIRCVDEESIDRISEDENEEILEVIQKWRIKNSSQKLITCMKTNFYDQLTFTKLSIRKLVETDLAFKE